MVDLANDYMMVGKYHINDSGERMEFSTGMVRDSADKIRYDLIYMPMLKRWADHMTKGAKKYKPRNWELASTPAELDRFLSSAFRHFVQWFNGEEDEDHASACWFNICGAEMVKEKLGPEWKNKLVAYQFDRLSNSEVIGIATNSAKAGEDVTIKPLVQDDDYTFHDWEGRHYVLDKDGKIKEI